MEYVMIVPGLLIVVTCVGGCWLIWHKSLTPEKLASKARNRVHEATERTWFNGRVPDAETFIRAETMLGNDAADVHQAGIVLLLDLVKTSPACFYLAVQNVLCKFMRDQSQPRATGKEPEADLIAALVAFSRLRTGNNIRREKDANWRPNLSGLNLEHYPLDTKLKINLSGALLDGARLKNAWLWGFDLSNALLYLADCRGTSFVQSTMRKTRLEGANLDNASANQTVMDTVQWPAIWKPGSRDKDGLYEFVRR